MYFVTKWWDQKRIDMLRSSAKEAQIRYLKISAAHSKLIRCSPKCRLMVDEKRSAKIEWKLAELQLKEALLDRIAHTT